MTTEFQSLTMTRMIAATPEAAYHAFSNAVALRLWFCDDGQADPRPGGRLYLYWDSGYYANGVFTSLVPNEQIGFTWFGRDEPGPSEVRISFERQDEGVLVRVEHFGIGTSGAWMETINEFEKGWQVALENLQSVLETGQDLRFVRRPMLGIVIGDEIDIESAEQYNLPVTEGVHIDGVMEGLGAAEAGLRSGDILVRIGDQLISGYASLRKAMDERYAGESVEVSIYRHHEKLTLTMELSNRPLPNIPNNAQDLAEAVRDIYTQYENELDLIFAEVSPTAADFQPTDFDWSAKEVVAHLIASERDTHNWIAAVIGDNDVFFNSNERIRLQATISIYPTIPELLAQLKRDQAETVQMLSFLPEQFVNQRKGSYLSLGYSIMEVAYHLETHLDQIRSTLSKAT